MTWYIYTKPSRYVDLYIISFNFGHPIILLLQIWVTPWPFRSPVRLKWRTPFHSFIPIKRGKSGRTKNGIDEPLVYLESKNNSDNHFHGKSCLIWHNNLYLLFDQKQYEQKELPSWMASQTSWVVTFTAFNKIDKLWDFLGSIIWVNWRASFAAWFFLELFSVLWLLLV